ncbi:MAG TPA: hypothetical protein VF793_00655 [Telluria sp.]
MMNISNFLKRLIGGDSAVGSSAASLRNIIVWVFIALVATFLTNPSGGPFSASDTPVPWPAELHGLDNALGKLNLSGNHVGIGL